MDGRRRQWQPIATDLAWTRTVRLLSDKFGIEGPWLWVLVILAAKRSSQQGTFRWFSESEGWERVGWDATGLPRPNFTLKEFFAYTGQTRRTRLTGAQQVEITSFGDWNLEVRRDQDAAKKRRKRATNTGDKPSPVRGTDLDLDSEREELFRTTNPEELEANAAEARRLMAELTRKVKSP